jgi:hypothetical protein
MQDVLTWGALIGAGGAIIAIITFWMNRGKAEAEALAKAEGAHSIALSALTKTELLSTQLNESRLEFARDYVNHKDLAAAEARSADLMNGVRSELRGMNDRLDRVIENNRHP